MEEPKKLMWWERFGEGLEEAVPQCPVIKNKALRGDEGWKKHEMDLLSEISDRVAKKKVEEVEESCRVKMMENLFEEKGLDKSDEMDLLSEISDRVAKKKKVEEVEESYRVKMMENLFEEKGLDKSDFADGSAIAFEEFWNSRWRVLYGSFRDVTLIRPMRYTYEHAPPLARPCDALQIFSARVIECRKLKQPLHVFGMIAVLDAVDRNRNLLFYRTRDNCQTLTETDPYLVLTGPTRAVVNIENEVVYFEIYLKVKGGTEDEDEHFLPCWQFIIPWQFIYRRLLGG